MEEGELPRSEKTAFSQFWFLTLLPWNTTLPVNVLRGPPVGKSVFLHHEATYHSHVNFLTRLSGLAGHV
jgi:hypothetical protein